MFDRCHLFRPITARPNTRSISACNCFGTITFSPDFFFFRFNTQISQKNSIFGTKIRKTMKAFLCSEMIKKGNEKIIKKH